MMRGTAGAMPAVAFVAPVPQVPAPVQLKGPAAAAQAQASETVGTWISLQQGVGIATAVACGAGVTAGRRRRQRAATVLRAGPKILEGTGGPRPNDFWDPAGLAKGKSDEQLLHWRAVELKHGRVSMLACLGWFHVAAGWHPIGDAAARTRVSDDPLINVTQLPIGGAFQLVFTIMCLEWLTTYVCKPPADKPWDILGWSDVIADENFPDWKKEQLKELNNGRLAMVGILGLIGQDMATGDYQAWIGQPFIADVPADWGNYVLPSRVMPFS